MADLRRRPLVCVVTDGRRWREDSVARTARLEALVQAAVEAGVALVHVREQDMDAGPLYDLVRRLARHVESSETTLLVNERADVAGAIEGVGVHLRELSVPTARVRAWMPRERVVGRSVHSTAGARVADQEGADYLCFGTVFASGSKGVGHVIAGLGGLRAVVETCSHPVLAIGGVTAENLSLVADAGAAGFAAIGLFSGGNGSEQFEPARAIEQALDAAARCNWR